MEKREISGLAAVLLLAGSAAIGFTVHSVQDESLNSAEETVRKVGLELSKDRPDYREVYDLISEDEANLRGFDFWKSQRDQLYGTYRRTGIRHEFEEVVNSSLGNNEALVWWKVRNYQSNPSRTYLKRTRLVKEDSKWFIAENVKISEARTQENSS